ncbi:hypothetical protein D3C81_08050 [compost metagenome]
MGAKFDMLIGLEEQGTTEEYLLKRGFNKARFDPVYEYSGMPRGTECLYKAVKMSKYYLRIFITASDIYFEISTLECEYVVSSTLKLVDNTCNELSKHLDYILNAGAYYYHAHNICRNVGKTTNIAYVDTFNM